MTGGPELFRGDKRMIYIFANGRRIQDYSLVQAFIYGTQGLFPNGTSPIGAVFVDIELLPFVNLWRIGKLNHQKSDIDWRRFGHEVEALCKRLGRNYYIKKDLRAAMEK